MNWLKQNWIKLIISIAAIGVLVVIFRYFLITLPETKKQERYDTLKFQYRSECIKSEENNRSNARALIEACKNQTCVDSVIEMFSDSIGESFIQSCILNKLNRF